MDKRQPKYNKRDSSTHGKKLLLRREALKLIDQPVIMETHGGTGMIYRDMYRKLNTFGIVFEKNADKIEVLARQRPAWAVYEGDCHRAIAEGVGKAYCFNLLDIDPHGTALPAIAAYLESNRPKADPLVIVATDCGIINVKFHTAWYTNIFSEIVAHFGNDFSANYLDACEWFVRKKATVAGYVVARFKGYAAGRNVFHFIAVLTPAGGGD